MVVSAEVAAKAKEFRDPTPDSVIHLLAKHYATKLLGLVGLDETGFISGPTKLPAEIIDPDNVSVSTFVLAQVEVETNLSPEMDWRMLEYCARFWRRTDWRDLQLQQHVLVLKYGSPAGERDSKRQSYTVQREHQTRRWSYEVHLLRNFDPEVLLADPVTAVFAPLARCADDEERYKMLGSAVRVIRDSGLPDRRRLARCLKILAGLRLEDLARVDAIFEEDAMPVDIRESATVQPLLEEARTQGLEQGLEQGQTRGEVLGMLKMKFGADTRIDAEWAERLAARSDAEELIRAAESLGDLPV